MTLTYKILEIRDSKDWKNTSGNPLKELLLTDLNSECAFQIWARIVNPLSIPIMGEVFDGPDNWVGRSIAIIPPEGKTSIEKWGKNDLIIDESPANQ